MSLGTGTALLAPIAIVPSLDNALPARMTNHIVPTAMASYLLRDVVRAPSQSLELEAPVSSPSRIVTGIMIASFVALARHLSLEEALLLMAMISFVRNAPGKN